MARVRDERFSRVKLVQLDGVLKGESGFEGGRSHDSEEDGMDEEETWSSEMESFSGHCVSGTQLAR